MSEVYRETEVPMEDLVRVAVLELPVILEL